MNNVKYLTKYLWENVNLPSCLLQKLQCLSLSTFSPPCTCSVWNRINKLTLDTLLVATNLHLSYKTTTQYFSGLNNWKRWVRLSNTTTDFIELIISTNNLSFVFCVQWYNVTLKSWGIFGFSAICNVQTNLVGFIFVPVTHYMLSGQNHLSQSPFVIRVQILDLYSGIVSLR